MAPRRCCSERALPRRHRRVFVDAFHVQAAVLTPPSEAASPAMPCFPRRGDRVFIAALDAGLASPRQSACVLATQASRVSPAGVRASLFSGSGPQERICRGGRERNHVPAGKELDAAALGRGGESPGRRCPDTFAGTEAKQS